MARGKGIGAVDEKVINGKRMYRGVISVSGHKYRSQWFRYVDQARAWNVNTRDAVLSGEYESPKEKRARLEAEKAKQARLSMTLNEFYQVWIDEYELMAVNGLRSGGTLRDYKSSFKNYIAPVLGNMPIRGISKTVVNEWYLNIAPDKPTTRQKAYRLLSSMLNNALEKELIEVNPCQVKGVSRVQTKHKPHIYTVEEYTRLLENIPRVYAPILAGMYYMAMRPGEIRALKWKHINERLGTVTVSETVVRGEKGAEYIGVTKDKETRVIPLHTEFLAVLPPRKKPNDYIVNINGERPTQKQWEYAFRKAVKPLGIENPRAYDLKHTCLTELINAGAGLPAVMELAGHSDVKTAMKYQAPQQSDIQRAFTSRAINLGNHPQPRLKVVSE